MTLFDVRIPGLPMTVVQADGNDVEPVVVDEFRIGTAETYDVIVQPTANDAYTIFAQAEDRTGFARGTLTPKLSLAAAVPPMDPRPTRTMMDMGMGSMDAMKGMDMPGMEWNGPLHTPVRRSNQQFQLRLRAPRLALIAHGNRSTSPRAQQGFSAEHRILSNGTALSMHGL